MTDSYIQQIHGSISITEVYILADILTVHFLKRKRFGVYEEQCICVYIMKECEHGDVTCEIEMVHNL